MPAIALPHAPLATGVVSLRSFRPEDADRVYEACQDADIARFTATLPSPYEREHAVAWIAGQPGERQAGTGVDLAIDSPAGELAGAIGLDAVNWGDGSARVGYWVAPWARGRGVATAALRLISGWALDTLGLRTITLDTAVENRASQRVAEDAGYRFAGEVPDVHGKFPAVWQYVLERTARP